MTQPRYAPIESRDEIRATKHLDPPRPWKVHRPGEHRPGPVLGRSRLGTAGPDQGYALRIAESLRASVVLGHGEHVDDALAVATQVALRRAAIFGRAPVRGDLEVALALLAYDAPISAEGAAQRRATVTGAAHDLWHCREVAASVDEAVLRMTAAEAANHAVVWSAPLPS